LDQNSDWIVYRRNDGLWAKKISGAKIASSVHPTQELAENSAREMLKAREGGRLLIEDFDGKIRSKDTFFQTVGQSLFRTRDTSS
jgi:hypothetical protein